VTEKPRIIKAPHAKTPTLSKQCGVFVSYQVDRNGKCGRYIACNIAEHTKNPKCPAKGGK